MATAPQNIGSQQPQLPPRPSLIKYIDEYRRMVYLVKARKTQGFSRMLDLLHKEIDRSCSEHSQKFGSMNRELPIPLSEDSAWAGEICAEHHNTLVFFPNLMDANDVFWAACFHEDNKELALENFVYGSFVCSIDKAGLAWFEPFLTSVYRMPDDATVRWANLSGMFSPLHRLCRLHLAQELMERHGTNFWSKWSLDGRGREMSTTAIDEGRKLYEMNPANRPIDSLLPNVLPPEKTRDITPAGPSKTTIISCHFKAPMLHVVRSFEDMALKDEEIKMSEASQTQAQPPCDDGSKQAVGWTGEATSTENTSSLSLKLKTSWADIKEFVPQQRSDSSQPGEQKRAQELTNVNAQGQHGS